MKITLTSQIICREFLIIYAQKHAHIGLKPPETVIPKEFIQKRADTIIPESELNRELDYFSPRYIFPIAANLAHSIPKRAIYLPLDPLGELSSCESFLNIHARVTIGIPDEIQQGYLYEKNKFPRFLMFDLLYKEVLK